METLRVPSATRRPKRGNPDSIHSHTIANPAGLFALTVDEVRRQDGIAIDRPVCDMLQNLFPLELEYIQRPGPVDEEIAQVAARCMACMGKALGSDPVPDQSREVLQNVNPN